MTEPMGDRGMDKHDWMWVAFDVIICAVWTYIIFSAGR